MSIEIKCHDEIDAVSINVSDFARELQVDESAIHAEFGFDIQPSRIYVDDKDNIYLVFESEIWGEFSIPDRDNLVNRERLKIAKDYMRNLTAIPTELLAMLIEWLYDWGYTGDQLADVVRKPWHYQNEIQEMLADWLLKK